MELHANSKGEKYNLQIRTFVLQGDPHAFFTQVEKVRVALQAGCLVWAVCILKTLNEGCVGI